MFTLTDTAVILVCISGAPQRSKPERWHVRAGGKTVMVRDSQQGEYSLPWDDFEHTWHHTGVWAELKEEAGDSQSSAARINR